MQCIVSTCCNDDSNSFSRGITFHSFPTDPKLRAAWLKALNKGGWKPLETSVVCSNHFIKNDLYVGRQGNYRIRTGAIPIVNVQEMPHTGDLRTIPKVEACRICFATDCKLYPISMYNNLDQAYKTFTGLSIENENKYFPTNLCAECAQRLLNCIHFKTKSLRAHSIMLEIVKNHNQITLESLKTMRGDHSLLKPKLSITHNPLNYCNLKIVHNDKNEITGNTETNEEDVLNIIGSPEHITDDIKLENVNKDHKVNQEITGEDNSNDLVLIPTLNVDVEFVKTEPDENFNEIQTKHSDELEPEKDKQSDAFVDEDHSKENLHLDDRIDTSKNTKERKRCEKHEEGRDVKKVTNATKRISETVNIDSDLSADDEQPIELNDSQMAVKTKEKYLAAYDSFVKWKKKKNSKSFSENVFLEYFAELENTYKPSTLWCVYSMLRSVVSLKHGVDIKRYYNLMALLRKRSDGYVGRKSKDLSPADVKKFLKEAPDSQYLATKVALIFGVTGGCTREELYNIETKDIEYHGELLLVKVTHSKTKTPRSFTIQGAYSKIVKKYQDLRSSKSKNDRFFQNYQKGKCTAQIIGINKFGSMLRQIAKYLGLPDADLYTGHSFRRTSATIMADLGADISKRTRSRRCDAVAEPYTEDCFNNKAKVSDKSTQGSNLEPRAKRFCPEPQPCTSGRVNDSVVTACNSFDDLPLSLLCTRHVNGSNKEVASSKIVNTVTFPSESTQCRFENCTFNND